MSDSSVETFDFKKQNDNFLVAEWPKIFHHELSNFQLLFLLRGYCLNSLNNQGTFEVGTSSSGSVGRASIICQVLYTKSLRIFSTFDGNLRGMCSFFHSKKILKNILSFHCKHPFFVLVAHSLNAELSQGLAFACSEYDNVKAKQCQY